MRKYRVLETRNKFYPQYRKYFIWKDFQESYELCFHTVMNSIYFNNTDDAFNFIDGIVDKEEKEKAMNKKIIYEYDRR